MAFMQDWLAGGCVYAVSLGHNRRGPRQHELQLSKPACVHINESTYSWIVLATRTAEQAHFMTSVLSGLPSMQDRNGMGQQVASLMLSALLTTGAAFAPEQLQLTQPAHADEESSSLSPFEKRKADLARRRELLQQAYVLACTLLWLCVSTCGLVGCVAVV